MHMESLFLTNQRLERLITLFLKIFGFFNDTFVQLIPINQGQLM